MSLQRVGGILLMIGFAALWVGAIGGPPGLYQTQDIGQRLQILETYQTRWIIDRVGSLLFILFVPLGFSIVAYHIWSETGERIPVLAGVAFVAASLSALVFIFLQTTDPLGGYSGAYPVPENLAYWLWLAGMVLFGVTFVVGKFPDWLGMLTAGVALIYSIVFLISGMGALAPFLLSLVGVAIGIVLVLM